MKYHYNKHVVSEGLTKGNNVLKYIKVNGSLYVSEGHHTMIANVMKYGKLNTGINMGQLG